MSLPFVVSTTTIVKTCASLSTPATARAMAPIQVPDRTRESLPGFRSNHRVDQGLLGALKVGNESVSDRGIRSEGPEIGAAHAHLEFSSCIVRRSVSSA